MKIQRNLSKFFLEDSQRGFNQAPLRCVSVTGDEVAKVLEEIHAKDCRKYQRGSRLFKQIILLSYYWPTMEAYIVSFSRSMVAPYQSNSWPIF